jgi:XTP/dITP diphosphohydrolase
VKRLLLATNNPGKFIELRRLLSGCGFESVSPGDLGLALEVEESGDTYEANAAAKARAFALASGLWALGDDSGIEIDALGGRPGVRSARYGGPGLDDAGRRSRLLEEMASVPDGQRTARFRAVLALCSPAGLVHTFEGVQEGCIARAARGSGGFGYDPLFLVDGRRTAAELPPELKDHVSHRGQAARLAAAFLRELAC